MFCLSPPRNAMSRRLRGEARDSWGASTAVAQARSDAPPLALVGEREVEPGDLAELQGCGSDGRF